MGVVVPKYSASPEGTTFTLSGLSLISLSSVVAVGISPIKTSVLISSPSSDGLRSDRESFITYSIDGLREG